MGTYSTSAIYVHWWWQRKPVSIRVVTYVSTNGCSVAPAKVSTGIARELELLDKKREGA